MAWSTAFEKKQKIWFGILTAVLIVYTVKSIFVGADIDESYGVTLGYRLIQGDKLLWDMWEPHQSSAVFTAFFIRVILFFTHGSLHGMTVLLRVAFFVVQTGIAWYVYRTFRGCVPQLTKWETILFAMIYYITTPKCNYVPEYSNLHVWFSTLLVLFWMQYYCEMSARRGKALWLCLAGAMMACDVLAYPGILLLFPFCLIWILKRSRTKLKDIFCFVLPCVLGAAIFMGYILSYMSVADIRLVLPCILGDGSHQMTVWKKMFYLLQGFGKLGGMILGCALVSGGICIVQDIWVRKKRPGRKSDRVGEFFLVWFFVQIAFQIICWMNTVYNSGYPQLAYIAVPVFGLFVGRVCKKRDVCALSMIGMTLINYAALNWFSNWEPACLNTYLVVGLLGGLLCFRQYFAEKGEESAARRMQLICVAFLLYQVFGRCLLMIGGENGNNMTFQVRGINREGVRAGILTSYMNAYRYNNNYDLFPEIVPEGSMVLYLGPSQFYYMLGDCRIASPTTISTPVYDESLQLYYELHPERYPDVVIAESCYGDLSYFDSDSYIMRWLEEEYQASEITDYPYVRVYKR